MAILGYDTQGSAGIGAANARLLLSSFSLATAGTLQELHGWFGPAGAINAQFRVAIYDDDGASGEPGTRLAYTNVFTYSGDTHVSQTGFSVALAAGNYWVGYYCISTGSGTAGVCYGETTGAASRRLNSSPDPPPNPAGGPGTVGTSKLSCWGIVSVVPPTTVGRFSRLKLKAPLVGTDVGGGVLEIDVGYPSYAALKAGVTSYADILA